jgi:DNA-binding response OmpR family regulator
MAGNLQGLSVLVVEDSTLVAMHIEEILLDAGCVVGVAETMDEALERCRREPPDVALLDINVNGQKAFALAGDLRAAGIPIMFSSGCAEPMLPGEFAGTPYISKPFEPEELLTAIESLDARPRQR